MKTYQTLPEKYEKIGNGKIQVIDGYAYAVRHERYQGKRDKVFRITEAEYNKLREEVQECEAYKCYPTEENLQVQIWSYLTDPMQENEPYCQTHPRQ